jgi:hypothetical protein
VVTSDKVKISKESVSLADAAIISEKIFRTSFICLRACAHHASVPTVKAQSSVSSYKGKKSGAFQKK